MPTKANQTTPPIPDPERRKILTALMSTAATLPAAKVLLAKKVDYGGTGS